MRHLISLDALDATEIERFFHAVDDMRDLISIGSQLCRERILATLFYEPSTRTRLSFECAMLRLGGQTLGFHESQTSSVAKGETIADTARMVTNYADIIVVRHKLAGTARVMAQHSTVPVINGGDDSHRHPTQALIDLYTIWRHRGSIRDLNIGICGDLRFSRTSHSLAYAAARLGAQLVHISPSELGMPESVNYRLRHLFGASPVEVTTLQEVIHTLDVLYVNRLQSERLPKPLQSLRGSYVIDTETIKQAKADLLILHPLPRVDELAYDLDSDPRATYFEQSQNGVPVRMALIASLLEIDPYQFNLHSTLSVRKDDTRCRNPFCVIVHEKYLQPEWEVLQPSEGTEEVLSCAYCGTLRR